MSLEQDPPFRSMVRASGLGEIWSHTEEEADKFTQFGWRCTNKENSYSNGTLIGNWNEKMFDIDNQRKTKPLPSQYEHYFENTYDVSYNTQAHTVPEELRHLKARHAHAHPSHQPELDSPSMKSIYNSWETTTRAAYVDPRMRKSPIPASATTQPAQPDQQPSCS